MDDIDAFYARQVRRLSPGDLQEQFEVVPRPGEGFFGGFCSVLYELDGMVTGHSQLGITRDTVSWLTFYPHAYISDLEGNGIGTLAVVGTLLYLVEHYPVSPMHTVGIAGPSSDFEGLLGAMGLRTEGDTLDTYLRGSIALAERKGFSFSYPSFE